MKTKLILLIAAFFTVAYAGAVPASQKPFDITQPDGTVITLHMVGDEYYHWTETTDNQVVICSEEGYYEYATIQNGEIVPSGVKASNTIVDSQVNTRAALPNREQMVDLMMDKRRTIIAQMDSLARAEELSDPSLNTRASSNISLTKGNQKVLCILMEFPDRSFTKTKADFQNMWNQTGYNVEGSMGSVKDFYYENSYSQMNVTATVVGPYMAEHNSSYYAAQDKNTLSESNVRDLVREAIQAAKDDVQFKNFDVNEDKFVDAVHIVFAGYAADANDNIGLIWSHKWQLQNAVWQGLYRAKDYFITSELAGYDGNKIAPIGTVCHEYGHQLGAPDFYNNTAYAGTGPWDVMGSGARNSTIAEEGRCPAHHNPYTKAYIFDWATPTVISSSVSNTNYTLSSSHNTATIYRINTSTDNEFFLLENRQRIMSTFNFHIPVPSLGGLLIYHIHSDIEAAIANKNVNGSHPQKCYIVSAKATSDPTTNPASYGSIGECAYPESTRNMFTSTSTPSARSWAGVATGVDLCYIKRSGTDITFLVNPRINGYTMLTSQETYTIPNLPTTANVKWTYTFTPSSNSTDHMSGNAITFVNGDSTASVVVKRGTYQTVETTLPDPETGIVPLPRPVIKLFAGTVVLKATITSGTNTYVTTKTITLPDSDNILPPINQIDGTTDTTIEVTATANVENNSIATYRLRHANPISADNSVVHVENLSDAGDDYIPYDGNYTLEVWHDQLGLVERIEDNTPYLYLDCGDMPTGVYQMILIVNEQIVAQSKLLKL